MHILQTPSRLAKSLKQRIILSVCLFVCCIGCKEETEQVGHKHVDNCLIATQTVKELVGSNQQSILGLETIVLNGESFQVSTTKKSVYTYDQQGRILTEYNQYTGIQAHYVGGSADSVFYRYNPTAVTIHTVTFLDTGKRVLEHAVPLNKQGFAEIQPVDLRATYDDGGYLMSLVNEDYKLAATIYNGDIIEQTTPGYDATPSHTYRYTYDVNRPGLIALQSFYGKPSRHLPTGYTIQQNGLFGTYPNVYKVDYTYLFNKEGLIKRQIFKGKNGEKEYLYGGGPSVKVTDFTYTCPD